ncbi:proteasome subunit beta type-5 isoform 1-T1 [Podargus strigoides]
MVYQYRGLGLSMGTMICGWDKRGAGEWALGGTGSHWEWTGSHWEWTGRDWESLGMDWESLGGTGSHWEWTGSHWEGLGGTGNGLANMVYQYRGLGLSMGTMICGWDKRGAGEWALGGTGRHWEALGGTGNGLANMVYQYRGLGLSMGTMICGWDKRGAGEWALGGTGRDWEALGGTGSHWEGLGVTGNGLANMVYQYRGLGLSMGTMICGWDKRGAGEWALGGTGRDWEALGGTGSHWEGLGGTGNGLANMVYQYRGLGLSMGTMICGWDKRGAGLYYVDSEGTRVPGPAFAVGSGAPYAYGVLDRGLRPDLGAEAACALARRAIFQAARRDAYSGGRVTVYHVGPAGWRHVSTHNVAELQELYGDGDGDEQ